MIGNSIGGQVATTFAHEQPERVPALVLLASSGLGEQREGYSLFPGDSVRRLVKRIEEDVVRAILRTVFSRDECFEEELATITERLGDRKMEAWSARDRATRARRDDPPALSEHHRADADGVR